MATKSEARYLFLCLGILSIVSFAVATAALIQGVSNASILIPVDAVVLEYSAETTDYGKYTEITKYAFDVTPLYSTEPGIKNATLVEVVFWSAQDRIVGEIYPIYYNICRFSPSPEYVSMCSLSPYVDELYGDTPSQIGLIAVIVMSSIFAVFAFSVGVSAIINSSSQTTNTAHVPPPPPYPSDPPPYTPNIDYYIN